MRKDRIPWRQRKVYANTGKEVWNTPDRKAGEDQILNVVRSHTKESELHCKVNGWFFEWIQGILQSHV